MGSLGVGAVRTGFQSASDPKYTVVPQRERSRSRGAEVGDAET